jgi:hypothetical protein
MEFGKHKPTMNRATLAILAALSASITLAEDFTTINGKDYKNVSVSRVEPDGIVLKGKSGITKVYFSELPKNVQERFHHDSKMHRSETIVLAERLTNSRLVTVHQKIRQLPQCRTRISRFWKAQLITHTNTKAGEFARRLSHRMVQLSEWITPRRSSLASLRRYKITNFRRS